MVGREGREGSEEQSHKEEEREAGSGTGEGAQGHLARERGLYLDIVQGATEFQVTPLLMGPVCILSQSRFEQPVCP